MLRPGYYNAVVAVHLFKPVRHIGIIITMGDCSLNTNYQKYTIRTTT